MLQANSAAVRSAVIRPLYGVMPANLQVPPPDASQAAPLISGDPGRSDASDITCAAFPGCQSSVTERACHLLLMMSGVTRGISFSECGWLCVSHSKKEKI